jgi:uncharacterized protein YehS (DUF1456 family)
MTNNDILRRLRYALNITDLRVMELFALAGYAIGREELESIFKKEDEAGYVECGASVMGHFLQGLILQRRGKKESPGDARNSAKPGLSNNDVLKQLRIALELKDDDFIAIMRLAKVELSRSEVTALFRKKGHPNFRDCGDQFLRNFLAGLTARYRV